MLQHVRRFLEAIAGVLDTELDRIIPRRRTPTGPVKSAELPPDISAAIVTARKAGQDPAMKLPRGWRGDCVRRCLRPEVS
jgi:hypothetical protein